MRASDIVRRRDVHRHVTVTLPPGRSAVGAAIQLYRDLGVDVEVREQTLCVEVGRVLAPAVQTVLERFTGVPAVNGWDR